MDKHREKLLEQFQQLLPLDKLKSIEKYSTEDLQETLEAALKLRKIQKSFEKYPPVVRQELEALLHECLIITSNAQPSRRKQPKQYSLTAKTVQIGECLISLSQDEAAIALIF